MAAAPAGAAGKPAPKEKRNMAFEDWVATKDDAEAEARAAAAAARAAKMAAATAKHGAASAAFEAWQVHKAQVERAATLLAALSKSRAVKEEGWRAVCEALACADVSARLQERAATGPSAEAAGEPKALIDAAMAGAKDLRSLRASFVHWSRRFHAFERVVLSPQTLSQLTRGFVAMLDRGDDGRYTLSSLTFAASKKGDAVRAGSRPCASHLMRAQPRRASPHVRCRRPRGLSHRTTRSATACSTSCAMLPGPPP